MKVEEGGSLVERRTSLSLLSSVVSSFYFYGSSSVLDKESFDLKVLVQINIQM